MSSNNGLETVSVIIPCYNEERFIGNALEQLAHQFELDRYEIIVVDGGSTDRTQQICARLGVHVITSNRGRARQMNLGASQATGDVLLFLHADTRLPASALSDISAALRDPDCPGGRFDVEIDGAHWMLKLIARLINHRSRITKVATGDQALFVRRAIFESMDGFQDVPLMEDIAFSRRLKRIGAMACLRTRVITSPARPSGTRCTGSTSHWRANAKFPPPTRSGTGRSWVR